MTKEQQEKLKKLPRPRCHKCDRANSYTNRLVKCHDCGYKFCPNHITCGQTFKGMKSSDPYADLCDKCVSKQHPT